MERELQRNLEIKQLGPKYGAAATKDGSPRAATTEDTALIAQSLDKSTPNGGLRLNSSVQRSHPRPRPDIADSRDQQYFKIDRSNVMNKTMEAFMPGTPFGASKFPRAYQDYDVAGLKS